MFRHSSPISGIAASLNFVATAGYDNLVILWDARTKAALTRGTHDHLANQCTFSPDGRRLASASSDHTARMWSVPEMKLQAVFKDHDDDVEMVVFHPTAELVATASRDHNVRVFEFTGKLHSTMIGHQADVISVEWSADGSELTSSSDDGTVRAWDPATGRQTGVIDMKGVETDTLVMSHDRTIYAGSDEGAISIIRNGVVQNVPAHKAGIKRLLLDRDRGVLVSLSYDRTLKVWTIDPHGGLKPSLTAEIPPIIWARSCAFNGETELVLGTFGSSFAKFDLHTQKWNLSGIGPTGGVNAVATINGSVLTVGDAGIVQQDGKPLRDLGSLCNFLTPFEGVVLTGGQTGQVFDAMTGDLLYTHTSPLNCGATFVSAGKSKAIVGAYTGEGLLFGKDDKGKVILERVVRLHTNAIKGVACNDEVIFSVCATSAAAWHSVRDCEPVRSVKNGHDKIANGCAVLAREGFASISRDLKLRIWLSDGSPAEVIETPHTHSIKCVAASPDGRYVATASYVGRAAVFDRYQRTWVYDRRLTTSGISSLTSATFGFLAGSYDGQVYTVVW